MDSWPISSDRLRAMYAGGQADATARRFARIWAAVFGLGLGRAMRCWLQEVPVGERPAVLKRYLQQVPGARPHFPVSRHADVTDFEAIASRYPVFLVTPDAPRDKRAADGQHHASSEDI